jgi:hypothetical protein
MVCQIEDFNNDDAAYISFAIRFDPVAEDRYDDKEEDHHKFLGFFDRAPVGDEVDQVVL